VYDRDPFGNSTVSSDDSDADGNDIAAPLNWISWSATPVYIFFGGGVRAAAVAERQSDQMSLLKIAQNVQTIPIKFIGH
jgi:hypothetical protein